MSFFNNNRHARHGQKAQLPTATVSLICAAAAVLLSACAQTSNGTRQTVQADTQAYRCAGFNPVADETDYPADVERAGQRLQNGPPCQNAPRSKY